MQSMTVAPRQALEWELAAIGAFDGMIRQIQADQYRRVQRARELAAEVDGVTPASSTEEREMSVRSFIAELATMLGQHEASASRMVGEAQRLTGPREATLEALEAGALGLTQVRSVLELTQDVPAEVADTVERVALDAARAAADRGVVSTNVELRRRMRRERERRHPEPLSVRRARAAEQRRVCVEPAPDGMAWLSLFVEAERALAIEARVRHLAARAATGARDGAGAGAAAWSGGGSKSGGGAGTGYGAGGDAGDAGAAFGVADDARNAAYGSQTDSRAGVQRATGPRIPSRHEIDRRTPAQRAADIAAELLLGGALPGDERTRDGAAATGAVHPRINVTVPVLTLLGLDDEPAELEGYGPVDADTARRLAGHAPSLRRILVHPETGVALSYGRESYRAPADLAGFVRVRDGRCRFPGCTRRAELADLDHTTAWARGGRTDASNLAALCRHHHRIKRESGWRVEQEPGGVLRWTSPAGHVLRTLPERPFMPIAAGEGVGPPGTEARAHRSPVPPDPNTDLDEEWQSLLDGHGPPPPF